ncbi:MAG: sulfatase [Myxococcota bacterium]
MLEPRAAGRAVPALLGICVLVALVGALFLRSGPPASAPTRAGPPNLVLLVLDTLRADHVGAYGGALPPGVSPELDAFAAEGVRFARAIAPSSWTRPSMGSLFTSRHPRTLGLYVEDGDALRDEFTTLAEALQAGGYRTLGLTANPNLNRAFNFQQGFDVYVEGWRWLEPGAGPGPERRAPLPTAPELFERALALAAEEAARPTCLFIQVMEIHEHHRPDALLRPENRDAFAGHPDAAYLASIQQLSHDVGAFVEALGGLPGWEDTLVLITSDHGEGLRNHPHVAKSSFHGRLLYDSQNWVPLVLWATHGARLPRGRVVEQRVRLLDLMPTLLDYAAAEPPEGMVGVSLRPLVDGAETLPALPELFVVETQFRGTDKLGVYGERFKLVHNRVPHEGTAPFELQQNGAAEDGLRTDAGERHPAERERLRTHLEAWAAEHPRVPAWRSGTELTEEEREQLRAIGYVP